MILCLYGSPVPAASRRAGSADCRPSSQYPEGSGHADHTDERRTTSGVAPKARLMPHQKETAEVRAKIPCSVICGRASANVVEKMMQRFLTDQPAEGTHGAL